MARLVRDEKTANLGLPLPYVENDQTVDVERIARSFRSLDQAYGEVRVKAAEAAEKAGVAEKAGEAAAASLEIASGASNAAAASLEIASGALGLANDVKSVAQAAAHVAHEASDAADSAKAAADTATGLASAAVPKSGARGSLAGNETASVLSGSQTIGIDSPDCLNIGTSGAVTLTFQAGGATARAVKAICLTAEAATTLTINGAVWASKGSAPAWGNAGGILVLIAHFVGGRVVLGVADNTQ